MKNRFEIFEIEADKANHFPYLYIVSTNIWNFD